MIKVGIVDDHAIVRSGLKQFLAEHVDLRVVGEAANGREAIDLVRNEEIDVLIMDLSMPGCRFAHHAPSELCSRKATM